MTDPQEALGINNRLELADADRLMRTAKVRELMLDGVTIEKPETVTIDAGRADRDRYGDRAVRADPGAAPCIGENCRIGACAIVKEFRDRRRRRDRAVHDRRDIEAGARGAGRAVRAAAAWGTMSAEGAHIGNFVELKKTRMGAGAKASHLAYLGRFGNRRRR